MLCGPNKSRPPTRGCTRGISHQPACAWLGAHAPGAGACRLGCLPTSSLARVFLHPGITCGATRRAHPPRTGRRRLLPRRRCSTSPTPGRRPWAWTAAPSSAPLSPWGPSRRGRCAQGVSRLHTIVLGRMRRMPLLHAGQVPAQQMHVVAQHSTAQHSACTTSSHCPPPGLPAPCVRACRCRQIYEEVLRVRSAAASGAPAAECDWLVMHLVIR